MNITWWSNPRKTFDSISSPPPLHQPHIHPCAKCNFGWKTWLMNENEEREMSCGSWEKAEKFAFDVCLLGGPCDTTRREKRDTTNPAHLVATWLPVELMFIYSLTKIYRCIMGGGGCASQSSPRLTVAFWWLFRNWLWNTRRTRIVSEHQLTLLPICATSTILLRGFRALCVQLVRPEACRPFLGHVFLLSTSFRPLFRLSCSYN